MQSLLSHYEWCLQCLCRLCSARGLSKVQSRMSRIFCSAFLTISGVWAKFCELHAQRVPKAWRKLRRYRHRIEQLFSRFDGDLASKHAAGASYFWSLAGCNHLPKLLTSESTTEKIRLVQRRYDDDYYYKYHYIPDSSTARSAGTPSDYFK